MGSPWHHRGWQMGDNSSDLASAGQVSAVGPKALRQKHFSWEGFRKQLMFVCRKLCGETMAGAGGAGKGRKRGRTACETAARGTPGVPGPGPTFLRLQSQPFVRLHRSAKIINSPGKIKKSHMDPGKCNPVGGSERRAPDPPDRPN